MLAPGLGDFRIPFAEHAQPPAEVAVAVGTRRTVMSAHREVDLAPGTLQLVGDLYPRRTGADHQYRTFGQLLRVVVVGRVDLPDTLVARRDRRDHRTLERASGGDHAVGLDGPCGGNRPPPGPCRGNRRDRCRIPFPGSGRARPGRWPPANPSVRCARPRRCGCAPGPGAARRAGSGARSSPRRPGRRRRRGCRSFPRSRPCARARRCDSGRSWLGSSDSGRSCSAVA